MKQCCSRETFLHFAFLTILAASLLFGNLGGAKLWDRDEPRNASCAEEMLQRGNLVTPIFNDEMRGAKPVLLYWLMIGAYQIFGVNEFSARFWSALLGCGSVLLTYMSGRRMFNARAGLLAALVLLTSVMFMVAGRAATPDSVLIFFVTLSITFFVYGAFPKKDNSGIVSPLKTQRGSDFPTSGWFAVLIYGALGFAVLGKGPVGLILPTAIMGMYLLIVRLPRADEAGERHGKFASLFKWIARVFAPMHFLRTCNAMRPLTAIGMVLAIAAPWYILVGIYTEGDFLTTFFWKEHFGRATIAMENHNGNVLYYPIMLMCGLFPWSVFTLPVVWLISKQIRRDDPWRNGYILSICWVAVWIGAFTIARTKLPSYATPCYPGAALLIGCFLYRWMERPIALPAWTYRLSLGVLAVVGLVIAIVAPIYSAPYIGGERWMFVLGAVPLIGGITAIVFQLNSKPRRVVMTVAGTAVGFCLLLFVFAAAGVSRYQQTPELLSKIEKSGEEKPALGAFFCMESSWVYYSKVPVHYLENGSERYEYEERSRDWRPKPKMDVKTFIESQSDPYLITLEQRVRQIRRRAGVELEEVGRTKYFLNGDTLVLLRPVQATPAVDHVSSDQTSNETVVR